MSFMRIAFGLIFFLGCLLRFLPALTQSFPLIHDGGMHLVLVQELVANGFSLSLKTSYNYLGIPFVYPPLSTYLVAFLHQLLGLSIEDILKFLPAGIACLTLPLFWAISCQFLSSKAERLIAFSSYSFIPESFVQLIKSGGISRGLGAVFALLTVLLVIKIFHGSLRSSWLVISAVSGSLGLTFLSHPEWSIVVVVLLLLAGGLTKSIQVKKSLLLAFGFAVVISSPWWLNVLIHHGLQPFLSISQGGSLASIGRTLLAFDLFDSGICVLLLLLGNGGFFVLLTRREFLLPFLAVALLPALFRGLAWVAPFYLSIFIGAGVGGAIYYADSTWIAQRVSIERFYRFFCCIVFSLLLAEGISLLGRRSDWIASPSLGEQEAFDWVKINVATQSKFLVLTNAPWWLDATNELFPALAQRHSLTTCQGREWLEKGAFLKCINLVQNLGALETVNGFAALERIFKQGGTSYVYLLKNSVPASLVRAAAQQPLQLVFENLDVAILRVGNGE